MKLKDIGYDIEYFLENRCYCPNEFYSFDGFSYMCFDKDTKIKLLGETKNFVVCLELKSEKHNQVLLLFKAKDQIVDNLRFDVTENNLRIVKEELLTERFLTENYDDRFRFDEFEKGSTQKMLEEILSIADAILID